VISLKKIVSINLSQFYFLAAKIRPTIEFIFESIIFKISAYIYIIRISGNNPINADSRKSNEILRESVPGEKNFSIYELEIYSYLK